MVRRAGESVMGDLIHMPKRMPPPVWARAAGVVVGVALFCMILGAYALAGVAQAIADRWEQ